MAQKDKTKKDTYMLKTLIKMYERGEIRTDHPLQRKPGRWSKDYRDGEIATIIKQEDIDPIKLCEQIYTEENGEQIIENWLIDGLQRLTYPMRYKMGGFSLGKDIEFPIVKYQKARKDGNGEFEKDENGRRIYDEIEYDLRGKGYNDLPEELKDAFDSYAIDVVKQLDCTNEEVGYHIRRYNKQSNMNVSEKTITYLDTIADKIKKLSSHEFFKNHVDINTNSRTKGAIDKIVMETLLLLSHPDKWTKDAKKQGLFLEENSTEEDFSYMETILDMLSEVIDDECMSVFNSKNTLIWIKAYDLFQGYNLPDEKYAEFIKAFIGGLGKKVVQLDTVQKVYGREVDQCSFEDLNNSKSTKDKGIIESKLHIIKTLMDEYFLNNDLNNEESVVTETENNTSDETNDVTEYVVEDEEIFDDSEMEPLEFIKQNVNPNATEEDLDDYYDYISSVTKKKIVNKNSNILNPNNENALLAAIAYGFDYCQNPKDLDTWIQRFSITHKSFIEKTQKEIFTEMISSLKRYCGMQKVGVA